MLPDIAPVTEASASSRGTKLAPQQINILVHLPQSETIGTCFSLSSILSTWLIRLKHSYVSKSVYPILRRDYMLSIEPLVELVQECALAVNGVPL